MFDGARLLYKVLGKFLGPALDLRPDHVSNVQMGDMFEELIRRLSEASNATPESFSRPARSCGCALAWFWPATAR